MPPGVRSNTNPADSYALFNSDKGFKAIAKELGTSPNTLRAWWVAKFGQEAFDARGKRFHSEAGTRTGSAGLGKAKKSHETLDACVVCAAPMRLNAYQKAKLTRVICTACSEQERGVDCHCPVCGVGCVGERGLSGHLARPYNAKLGFVEGNADGIEPHAAYLARVQAEEARLAWEGKVEGQDYVVCRLCEHRAETLARHLLAEHKINADLYRMQFPDAPIRSEALTVLRKASVVQSHVDAPHKGLTRTILCDDCDHELVVSAFFAYNTHDARCPECKQAALDAEDTARWEGLSEPEDFVTCQTCGCRAENLTSHVSSEHPDLVGHYMEVHPEHLLVALNSAVRDKTALKGKTLSDATKALMSANAGRWNKGLTKETDERVAALSASCMGRPSWSNGLTKETHPSLLSTSTKLSAYVGDARPWSNGLKADLEHVDFTPYLDETGAVNRKDMADALDLSEPTLSKYMETLGLRLSKERFADAVERRVIRLEKADLQPFALANGKIVVGRAMAALGRDFKVIKRECIRHGLPLFTHGIRQSLCLDAVSKALGGAAYKQEWRFRQFCNPVSGHMFRFDGYFPALDLLVEYHGWQHWVFPSIYAKTREVFDALQERDREKVRQVTADGRFKLLEIREDEPYTNVDYLRGRLLEIGVFEG